jgi:hypothetical protein
MTAESSVEQSGYNLRLVDIAEEPKKLLLPIEGYEKMPLVTLEEAVEPIVDFLPDIRSRAFIAKNNSENPKDGLTVDLSAAIMLYTMGKNSDNLPLYYVLNSILRSKESDRSEQLKPWFYYLKLFITALSYLPSYRGTVYRGVKCDMSDYYTINKKFVWWGFSSCTKSLGVLQSELFLGQQGIGTLFIIECFSGKEIRSYSHYEKEDEVLLVAARQFIVVDRLNPKPALWIIQVREIDPPFQFLKTETSISSTFEVTRIDDKKTSDAETSTDDLPCRIEDTVSNEKPNASSTKNEEDNSNTSVLINSLATRSLNFDFSGMPTTIDSDTLMSAEPVKNESMGRTLSIKNRLITEESAKILAEDIRQNTKLEIFYFCNNGLKDLALYHIIHAITDRTAVKVFMRDNNITDASATWIGEVLYSAPKAISHLYLEKNRLTVQGVKSIVQALLNTPDSGLKALSFTGNHLITDECIDDIIQLFNEKHTLKSLYLDQCNFSDVGREQLRLAKANRRDFSLQL